MNVEIVSSPATAAGESVAILPAELQARSVTSISVANPSGKPTVALVYIGSVFATPTCGTSTGNGDTAGGSPLALPPGAPLCIRWIGANPGTQGRSTIQWEWVGP